MAKFKKIFVGSVGVLTLSLMAYGIFLSYSVYHFAVSISNRAPGTLTRFTDYSEVYTDDRNEKYLLLKEKLAQARDAMPDNNGTLNILVVGVDFGAFKHDTFRPGWGRSDTIMIFSIDGQSKRVSLLSIPRDTYVNIPGRGMDKINHAFAFGGINLSAKTISQFLKIPINHYIRLNYDAFTKTVDELGGVSVNVTEDVVYFGDGKVKVPKGLQSMDGATAFDYVQVRQGDITRVQRQQKFVKAAAEQALSISNIAKLPAILQDVAPDIDTDLSPKEMLNLLLALRSTNLAEMHSEIVPGKADMIKGISYWIPDDTGTSEAVKRCFR